MKRTQAPRVFKIANVSVSDSSQVRYYNRTKRRRIRELIFQLRYERRVYVQERKWHAVSDFLYRCEILKLL